MNRMQRFTSRLWVLVVFGVCLFSIPVSAQTVAKGEFDLPCAAKWGLARLPAGHYTFLLDSTAKQGKLIVRGASSSSLIRATAIDGHDPIDQSELVLVRNGPSGVVRALRLAELGITLYYAMPASAKLVADNHPELIQRAPITVSGK